MAKMASSLNLARQKHRTNVFGLVLPFSVLDPLQLEDDWSEPIGTAGNGHPLFFHPGIVAPVENVHQIPLNVRIGPIAEARGTVMTIDNELLAHLKTIAFSGHPPLVISGGWFIPI